MKIGLITIYSVPNYGSVLQAFATQQLLLEMGYDCRIVNYKYPNRWHYKHGVKRESLVRRIITSIAVVIGLHAPHRKQRVLFFFKRKYLSFTKQYTDYNKLRTENWNDYDAFIVGSDQVWNTSFLKGDKAFLLSFLPDSMKRISLASSFALTRLPDQYVSRYRDALRLFSNLSVRESDGVDIITDQLGIKKDVFVCLDPTLLLGKNDWIWLIPRSKISKRPFILYYMWSYAFEPRPYIYEVLDYWKKKLGISDVVALEGYSSKNGEMKCAEDSTIPEFIDYFSNASLVITSSFHGTAFALNFSRPLISIVPNNSYDNRQRNLCESIGAKDCIVEIGQRIQTINPYYDVNTVEDNLNKRRDECLAWIKEAIECQ